MCGVGCKFPSKSELTLWYSSAAQKLLYSPTKTMQALFMDLIISASVLESEQWQPTIQELLK